MSGPSKLVPDWRTVAVMALTVMVVVIAVSQFLAVEKREHGWLGVHRYGYLANDVHAIQTMPRKEALLYASLLWLLPVPVLIGLLASRWGWLDSVVRCLERRWRHVAAMAALVALGAGWWVGHGVLQQTPITDDGDCYRFHARILAKGQLTAASPPDRSFYDNIFLINNGRWYSQYSPGHPAALVPGVWLGDPWTVPPLLAALTVLLVAAATRRLYGRLAAAVAAALLATSPFLAGISGTLLAHSSALAALALCLWLGLEATRSNHRRARILALGCALAYGVAVLCRAVPAVLVGGPLLLLLARRLARCGDLWRRMAPFALGGVAMLGLQLWLNWRMNGHPLVSGYQAYWEPIEGMRSPFGFGPTLWNIVHTPERGLAAACHNLVRLNAWLLGWPLSLALPVAGLALTFRRATSRWLLVGGTLTSLVLVFYFWPGIREVGPVLLAETLVVWLPLAGVGVAAGSARWRRGALAAAAASIVLAVPTFYRAQVDILRAVAANAGRVPATVAAGGVTEPAVVFTDLYPVPNPRSWRVGRPNPWPDLRDPVLYVLSHGDEADTEFARRQHPQRTAYKLVEGRHGTLQLAPLNERRTGTRAP